ncbi:sensor histidine kinase [Desulfonema ishimotonii]|uniref:histidine kinase n=1 Tax=Desulfonema ishimotonii TaxID=45657 RepID=A0A401FWA3_9BACT|nr:histidine kinase dimerization/phospho-acceptor domain-containing protein [Desulfonema ishimotonii]GBC61241.1 sensor histidine kinase [Desulfonema ishimotonii]
MDLKPDTIYETGLRTFGRISADISHEIKNALAIINENAGLMEDLSALADQGMPVEPQRFRGLAANILKQIGRADDIVKKMNRFAHSTDEAVRQVDLGDTAAFVAALSGRLAAMHRVSLDPVPPDAPVLLTAHLFFLETLLHRCLSFAIRTTEPEKTVRIVTCPTEIGGQVRLCGIGGLPHDAVFPGATEKALAEMLKSRLVTDAAAGEIRLDIPGDVTSSF